MVPAGARAVPIAEVDSAEWQPRSTGSDEIDRVLGGGLVPGSVTLVGGEPGMGKSTLLLQVASSVAQHGRHRSSTSPPRSRPSRCGCGPSGWARSAPKLFLASETALPHLLGQVEEISPDLLVVDSIQTIFEPALSSAPGSVAQVRECTARLVRSAKSRDLATVLVGHVTKDGALAGPRVLEHTVDTVLSFDGDRHHALRLLRATKHRFGTTDELGLFEMGDGGLRAVPDASGLFLADRRPGVSGVGGGAHHRRPPSPVGRGAGPRGQARHCPSPRRSTQGLDSGRLPMLLAVLARRAGTDLGGLDVYALAVGGVKVVDPGADLGVALALASSLHDVALPDGLVVVGEIGLGGELRQVAQCHRRLTEALRLGYRRAIVPRLSPEAPSGIDVVRAATLAEALGRGRYRPEWLGAVRVDFRGDPPAKRRAARGLGGGRPRQAAARGSRPGAAVEDGRADRGR